MIVIDPGHSYLVDSLDGGNPQPIDFVKREGQSYPGNIGHHPGTNCQELLRVLINRYQYLNKQIYSPHNISCIDYARRELWHLEYRASERHGRVLDVDTLVEIEDEPYCPKCGHIHRPYCQ